MADALERAAAAGVELLPPVVGGLYAGRLFFFPHFTVAYEGHEESERYDAARGEYYDAAQTYRKVYGKTNPRKERKLRGEIAFKMGECYRRINMAPRSAAAYQHAIRSDSPDSMALFYLARSQQFEGKYKEAIQHYQAFLETNHLGTLAKNGIIGCNLATQWKENTTRYVVNKAKILNSRRSACSPLD